MLEGRHGGLVDTKALGEDNGPCLLYGYDYGFGFLCLLLQASGCCRRDFPQGLLPVLMEVSARSEKVVADFLSGESTSLSCSSLPIIPASDFTLKKWIGDGDWRIALAMN